MVKNATGLKGKILRTDNGGGYVSLDFSKYCKDKGIFQQFTNPYTQNRMAHQKGLIEHYIN